MKTTLRAPATLLAVLLLVGCNPGGQTTPTPSTGVRGTVTAGPTCPVVSDPPDPGCADRPVAGAVIVVTDAAGAQLGRVTTAADGTYTMGLGPGAYTLTPQPANGLLGTATPQDLRLESGDGFATIDFSYDTGIR